jgi:hypothetical protein
MDSIGTLRVVHISPTHDVKCATGKYPQRIILSALRVAVLPIAVFLVVGSKQTILKTEEVAHRIIPLAVEAGQEMLEQHRTTPPCISSSPPQPARRRTAAGHTIFKCQANLIGGAVVGRASKSSSL